MPYQTFENDEQALLRIAAGDMVAYRFLFDRYFADLCNYLVIYLHAREVAEEVALEIFEMVWEKREMIKIKTSFRAFLFAAAKNRAISHYRKEHRAIFTTLEFSETLAAESSDSQKVLEEHELRQLIDSAISKLPEKSRQIYQLARNENLSHKEIANQLGITPKTVENHIGIALRKLRETLSPLYKQIFMGWLLAWLIK